MNLFLFPEAACRINGYGIAVEAAYKKFQIKYDDVVVWYSSFPKDKMLYVRKQDYIIKRPGFFSYKSIRNTLFRTNRSEVLLSDLNFLRGLSFEKIYCDETCFYHAIRKLYPDNPLVVRFHNSFARIHDRLKLLKNRKIDFLYRITLNNMYNLERDVMNDKNVFKVFISDEDRHYYTSHYGKYGDSETFYFKPDMRKAERNRTIQRVDHRLIWFGGVESHKKTSILWFICNVFPKIRQVIPDVEFHMWGRGTEQFNNPANAIFGNGFFNGVDMPSKNSLYVNPDIIGGGIKIKLISLIEAGLPIISTPFGFEGYKEDILDKKYCIVEEEELWADCIIAYLNTYGA